MEAETISNLTSLFIYFTGCVGGFICGIAWHQHELDGWKELVNSSEKQYNKMKMSYEILVKELMNRMEERKQPRLSNGRFVSRKQIVTEELRREQGR